MINPYLYNLPNIIVTRSSRPICHVPVLRNGNKPTDKGYLSKWSSNDVKQVIKKHPVDKRYFKPIVGANEFLHNKSRWCLWLYNVDNNWLRIPEIKRAVKSVSLFRKSSKAKATRDYPYPYLFRQIEQPDSNYLLIPRVTSKNRQYIPIGYMSKNVIMTDLCQYIPNATYYMFGILESQLHMLWVGLVSGRFGPSFRYSAKITYNNFPWSQVTDSQKELISATAQGILNARKNHHGESLADLYNPLSMPVDLQKAHRANDRAVLKAYGLKANASKNEIITKLLKMYLNLTKKR